MLFVWGGHTTALDFCAVHSDSRESIIILAVHHITSCSCDRQITAGAKKLSDNIKKEEARRV